MQQQQQSSFSSSSSTQQQSQVKSILKQPKQLTQQQTHGEEIQQESLKTTIQSAITDIGNDNAKLFSILGRINFLSGKSLEFDV